ncbi:MAG: LPS export ABC transporter permease LptG, partial [Gammaproteobacteria bacterium]|nr:LPS export ABC transporter permease LptG [Gammaproteobacteria bacterium]
AMKPALVVVVVGALLGEYGAPYFERIAQSEKAVAQGSGKGMESSGLWHREGNTYMHFNAIEPNGVLHGVSLFEYDDQQRLQTSLFAQRALYQRDQWLLEDLVITRMADTQVTKEQQASRVWETELSPKVLNVLIIKPDNLSMSGLFTYGRYLGEQGLNAAVYWMAFWKKALQPLATAVLVLVAISFVFGPLRSVTMGFRVFTGIVVGLLFKYMQDLLGPLSMVFGFDPVVSTLAPILICAAAGTVLLRRAG